MSSLLSFTVAPYDLSATPGKAHLGDATVIRAEISQILSLLGNRALAKLAQAVSSKNLKAAQAANLLLRDSYEPAIALANNPAALAGLAAAYGLVGNREK